MKHFLSFVVIVFSVLFLAYVYRDDAQQVKDKSSIKVYAPGSFISNWGPGPELQALFESTTGLKISFVEMSDPNMTFQKMSLATDDTVGDVVLGLDQYDIIRAAPKVKWRPLNSGLAAETAALGAAQLAQIGLVKEFIPYDWSAVAIVNRDTKENLPRSLQDLLKPEFKGKIALQDPRTSSPGLQFLLWVAQTRTEDQAIQYLNEMNNQAHSFSASWSTAYGLFKNKTVDYALSYVTSPIYHLVEEKDKSYHAIEFAEGHPVQVEFAGVLASCANCEVAAKFVYFLQTKQAQRIIMNKNYMLPMDKQVVEGTAFDTLTVFKLLDFRWTTKEEINKWLRIWSDIRKNEG